VSIVCAISCEQPFDRFSRNCAQFVALLGGKLRVERQHLNGESHFVDDALTRSVPAGEQFKVLNSVVRTDAVDVVDGFVRAQVAPDVLLHNVTVLKNFHSFFVRVFSDGHSQVSVATNERFRRAISVSVKHCFGVKFVPAFFVTDFSTEIEIVRAVSINDWQRLTAIQAHSSFLFKLFGGQTFIRPRALATTILGVFTPTFLIGAKLSGSETECFGTSRAGKFVAFRDLVWATFHRQIRKITVSTAKLARSLRTNGELFCTVSAGSYHGNTPSMLALVCYTNSASHATSNLNGAL
jgi:hypothetical protein